MKKREEDGKSYCRDWRRWWSGEGCRRSRIGIFLIIIGVLWLGAKLGLFNPDFFWPLAFIAVGTWIVVLSLFRGKSSNRQN